MPVVAFLVLVALAWLLGQGFIGRFVEGPADRDPANPGSAYLGHWERRWVMAWISGLVALYLLLLILDLLGVPWRALTVLPLALVAAVLGWPRGRLDRSIEPDRPGWGDAVAILAFTVFTVCSLLLWNLHPDFIYHWGIKGAKFHLAQGLDFTYLASPWNAHVHPDYPNLLPSLFALTAILVGAFREAPAVLWSVLFFALAVLAARDLLGRLGASPLARQAGVATVALVLAMFGVGYLQAGGADWLLVLAVLAGTAILASPLGTAADFQLGAVAAFAAASKIEGVPLAVFLIAVHLARRCRQPLAQILPAFACCSLPAASVAGIWAYQVQIHKLFQPTNVGALDLASAGIVFGELLHSFLTVNWHGLTFCLLALPLLFAVGGAGSPARRISGVLLLQLAFYVYVYMSAPVDPREYVSTSAARLFFHLVPATLVLLLAVADGWSRSARDGNPDTGGDQKRTPPVSTDEHSLPDGGHRPSPANSLDAPARDI